MKTSLIFDEYYYAHDCGSPYKRDGEWIIFFDHIAERIIEQFEPRTILDAGCAWGVLVEAFRKHGLDASGVDISEFAIQNVHPEIRPYCWIGSITEPFPKNYDLITCIEVLEHMPQREAEKAIENFCKHANEVIFSSTPFDYKEVTHINVQDPEYWASQFARFGFYRDMEADMSYITSWAVRFVKGRRTNIDIVRDYERKLWHLKKENFDLRQLAIDNQNQLRQKEKTLPDKLFSTRARGLLEKYILCPFTMVKKARETKKNLILIRSSGLFDEPFYLTNNPDVAQAKMDPALHYLRYGGFEGRDPGPNFSSARYFDTHEDVKHRGVNPLVHYLKYDRKERISAQPD